MYHRLRPRCIALTSCLLLAQAVVAGPSPQTTVAFDPAATTSLQRAYGANEADVLRSVILAALAKQQRGAALPDGITLKVTVRKVVPTHPTMQQQLDNPSLSPARTHYLGGADLVGELRDSQQQVLATVNYRNFAGVLPASSPSLDPWADARQAIDTFAAKLAATWGKLPTKS
jgi:hypothetical protein